MRRFSKLLLPSLLMLAWLAGCATNSKSANEPYRMKAGKKALVLEAAYRVSYRANLCFLVHEPGHEESRRITVSMPMPDGPLHLPLSPDGVPVWQSLKTDVTEGVCSTEGKPMVVVGVSDRNQKALPNGEIEAIYTVHRDGVLLALGYMSSKPILSNHHSYAFDMAGFVRREIPFYKLTLSDLNISLDELERIGLVTVKVVGGI